jgi:protein disulfide-isomerase
MMYQKLSTLVLATLVLLTAIQVGSAQESIQWLHSLPEAQAKAKADNRLVLVHFWSTTCPPCKKLEKTVFPDPRFTQAIGRGYVPVKVNINENPELARRFRVKRIPTDLFLTAEGAEVYRTISPQDPEKYVGLLGQIHEHVMGLKKPQNDAIAAVDAHRRSQNGSRRNPAGTRPNPADSRSENRLIENRYNTSHVVSDSPSANPPLANPPLANPSLANPSLANPSLDGGSRYSVDRTRPVSNPHYASGTTAGVRAPDGQQVDLNNPRATADESIPVLNRPDERPAPIVSQQQPDRNTQTQNASRQPNSPPQQFALLGYCPVALIDSMEWKAGNRSWGARHEGQVYLFTTEQNQKRFLASPQSYIPGFRGFDAVYFHTTGQLVPGKCDFGIVYGDEYYLFADEVALNRFWQQPDTYIQTVRQANAQARSRR